VQFSDTIGYDAFGRLNEISRDNSGLPGAASRGGVKANFHYDAVGRLDKVESKVKRTSGTLSDVVKTDYVFDTSGRLGTIKHAFLLSGGGTNPTSLDYTNTYFNKTTLLKSTHSAVDGLQQFTYDAAKQLDTVLSSVIVQPSDYNFDANGNRTGVVNGATTKTYQQGTDNRLLSDGVLEYKYNKEGARVNRGTPPPPPPNTGSQGSGSGSYSSGSSSGSAGSQYDTYLWDHRGRLTEIQSSKYGTQAKQVKYAYDAFDRRVAKEFAGGSSSGSYSSNGSYGSGGTDATDGAERYIYDGDHLLAVLDRDGDVIEQVLHGPMVDQVLAEEHFNSLTGARLDVSFAIADHLGSVRHVLKWSDTANNVVAQDHIFYDTFGVEVSETNPSVKSRFGFTGRDRDRESGLQYYRARYYDPKTGNFISQNPIGFAAGDANLYRYVGNGPTNERDPSGLIGDGHHLIPRSLWNLFPSHVTTVFDFNKIGEDFGARLRNDYFKVHDYGEVNGILHSEYNAAVREELAKFEDEIGRSAKKFNKTQAGAFLGRIQQSQNPTIKAFNEGVRAEIKIAAEWGERNYQRLLKMGWSSDSAYKEAHRIAGRVVESRRLRVNAAVRAVRVYQAAGRFTQLTTRVLGRGIPVIAGGATFYFTGDANAAMVDATPFGLQIAGGKLMGEVYEMAQKDIQKNADLLRGENGWINKKDTFDGISKYHIRSHGINRGDF